MMNIEDVHKGTGMPVPAMNPLLLVKQRLLKAARLHQAQLASINGYRSCVA